MIRFRLPACVLCGILASDVGWVRFARYLIFQWKHKDHPPVFSERYGYRKFLKLYAIGIPYRVRIGLEPGNV